jgi:hypothetical protein
VHARKKFEIGIGNFAYIFWAKRLSIGGKSNWLGKYLENWTKLTGKGHRLSSDAGLFLYRELDEVLGLTAGLNDLLAEPRKGKNIQHSVTALLRLSVYGQVAGYEDTNDAARLRVDQPFDV